jgi:uncharacterized Fe-S cluster-containing protein
MSRIYSEYGTSVRIVIEGHNLIVQKFVEYNDIGWVRVAAFHEISDDYAFSNARECAESTLAKMKESA